MKKLIVFLFVIMLFLFSIIAFYPSWAFENRFFVWGVPVAAVSLLFVLGYCVNSIECRDRIDGSEEK